nr:hypothetical protein [Granulosicoccus sp.]
FEPPPAIPMWQKLLDGGLIKQVLAGLGVLLLILLVVRPAMKNLSARTEMQAEAELAKLESSDDAESDSESDSESESEQPDALPPPTAMYGDILHVARAMANEDPERVARVVKEWVHN